MRGPSKLDDAGLDLSMSGPWAPNDEEALKGQNKVHDFRRSFKSTATGQEGPSLNI